LEAIEYFLTGENARSEDGSSYRMKAYFEGHQAAVEFRHEHELFRQRDQNWFNAHSRFRGNSLNKHFNRFNFFNTDAAFALSNTSDEESTILQAIEDIALGDEVNSLKTQLQRYKDKLEYESKSQSQAIDELVKREKDIRSILENQRPSKESVQTFFKEATTIAKSIEYVDWPKSTDEDLANFEMTLLKQKTFVDNALKILFWLDRPTIYLIKEEKEKLENISGSARETVSRLNVEKRNCALLELERNEKSEALGLFTELLPYYKNYKVEEVVGLNEKLTSLSSDRERIHDFRIRLAKILPPPDFGSGSLSENIANLEKSVESDAEKLARLDTQISTYLKTADKITALKAELKSAVVEYLQLSDHKKDCPVCHYNYPSARELLDRIYRVSKNKFKVDKLTELHDQKRELENDLVRNTKIHSDLMDLHKLIDEVCSELSTPIRLKVNNFEDVAAKDAITILHDYFDSSSREIKEQIEVLDRLRQSLYVNKLSETSLVTLQEGLTSFQEFSLNDLTSEKISGHISSLHSRIQVIGAELQGSREISESYSKFIQRSIQDYDSTIPSDVFDDIIRRRINFVGGILDELTSKGYQIPSQMELTRYSTKCNELIVLLNLTEEQKKKMALYQSQKIEKNSELKEVARQLKKRRSQEDRILIALDVIKGITIEHNAENHLEQFFEKNIRAIKRTFLAIHKPSEFEDIRVEEGKIVLVRKDNVKSFPNSISSGQRSALALSIFLTLNAQLGEEDPVYILLDDPVTYVDDLNTLLFLDYLREIALKKNRQIFFATADHRLASLFKKKFQVMGEDFNVINLQRDC